MSEIANNIWNVSGPVIENLFIQLESGNGCPWRFVITGHSLGAGTAALLNIECHVRALLGNRQVKCFAFASPPVFNAHGQNQDPETPSGVADAIKNATAYIYGDDCVPFLSQTTVSRLAAQIQTVDKACQHLWRRDRVALASGQMPIPRILVQEVSRLSSNTSSEILSIPAAKVIWLRRSETGDGFSAVGCLSEDLAKCDIHVSDEMVSHHMPSEYEESLEKLLG